MWWALNRTPTSELAIRAALMGAALLFVRLYRAPAEPAFLLCGFRWLTGYPCPLCGMTRALCSLAKGEWQQALHFHPFSPLVLLGLVALFVWNSYLLAGRSLQRSS
jgi:hypothetical protein